MLLGINTITQLPCGQCDGDGVRMQPVCCHSVPWAQSLCLVEAGELLFCIQYLVEAVSLSHS